MGRGKSKLETLTPGGGGNSEGNFGETPGFSNIENLKDAIGKKGRKMSIEAAAKGANPYYNPEYSEFSENCQRAVVAYEMRRRGYNVTAQPSFKGDDMGRTVYKTSKREFLRLTGAFQGARTEKVGKNTAKATEKSINDTMKGYGNGSRAIMTFGWKKGNTGHAVSVEYSNNKVKIVDPQVGGKYNTKQLLDAIKTNTVTLTRTDKLKVSERMKKSVEKANRR